MAQNKILPWAQTGTANVLSDSDYASDVASGGLYGDGVKTGQASSKQANKTWRQATAPGAGLGQFLVDNLSVDVTDADTPAAFSTRIANAVLKLAQISPFNQSWATATGGYRKYAIVSDSSGNFWVSTADQNTTVPGADGAKWQSLFTGYLTQPQSDARYVQKTAASNTDVDFTPNYAGINRSSGEIWLQYKDDRGAIKYAFAQVAGDYATNAALNAEITRAQTTENLIKSTFRFINTTSATTITVPQGVNGIEIREAVGGGGGGAGCQAASASGQFMGAGGGAGSVVRAYFYVNPGDTITLTPGAGGVGVTGAPINAPSNGGFTYVSRNGVVIATASGGQGGYWADSVSSVGGLPQGASGAAGTYEAISGGTGQDGQFESLTLGGCGASGPAGGAGHAGSTGGTDGASYGAGGGGAFDPGFSGNAYKGGNGFQGRILWRWMPVEGG